MSLTLEQYGKSLVAAGLMTADELRAWFSKLPADRRPRDAETLAKLLADDGKVTNYQNAVLQQGKPQALTFANYLLVEQLGSGASGHVFKGKHKTSGRLAAIKVLAAETAADPKALKRFQREVEAAGRLAHKNIVQSFDAGEWNGQHYLVMDYVDGCDMASLVKSGGPLKVETACGYIVQAAQGLRYAHEQGVVHRDIKPGNLLLDKNGAVRILDLGLVRFSDSGDGLTATQQVMGTVDYMSPEQAADTKRADARCDIYSLGATLWYFLMGKKLYEAKGVVERIMLHRSAPIPSLCEARPEVPRWVDDVFRKMVAKRVDDRFQTMADVIRAFETQGASLADGDGSTVAEVEEISEKSMMALSAADKAQLARTAPIVATSGGGEFALDLSAGGGKSRGVAKSRSTEPAVKSGKQALPWLWIAAGSAGALIVAVVIWMLMG